MRFAQWLRKEYLFPVRVPVYLAPSATLRASDGTTNAAIFFGPYSPLEEPYIRMATGDYSDVLESAGSAENAAIEYLESLAHELVHYWQWVKTGQASEEGVDEVAEYIVGEYGASMGRVLVGPEGTTTKKPSAELLSVIECWRRS